MNNEDAGYSLLEVVLAISILALISLPLLRYFTDSIRYSSMETRRQQALFFAQEITEGLLAESRLVTYVADPAMAAENYAIPYLANRDYKRVEDEELKLISTGQGSAVFEKETDSYNVRVTIENVSTFPVNKVENFSDYGIDPFRDVVHTDTTEYTQAVLYFMEEQDRAWRNDNDDRKASNFSESDIEEKMERVMTVKVDKETSGQYSGQYRVTISYQYYCTIVNDGNCCYEVLVTDEYMEDLRNVYVFYDWCDGGDTVKLDIPPTLGADYAVNKLGLNIVCQKRDGYGLSDDEKFPPLGDSYKLYVGGYKSFCSIYTNLGIGEEGHTYGDVQIEGDVSPSGGHLIPSEPEKTKTALTFSIRTEVYSTGSWSDPLAVIETSKGE